MFNVTIEPGDMVLCESYSVIHGRPFPLKRRYYANIFIHFEPTGHSLCHNAKVEPESNVHEKYHEATSSRVPFLVTPEIEAKLVHDGINERPPGSSELKAQNEDITSLAMASEKPKSLLSARDGNGWTPTMHEGARGGHMKIVSFSKRMELM